MSKLVKLCSDFALLTQLPYRPCSCDSYGNRPITVPTANSLRQQRPVHYGSGRIRSGSMGNRPQVAAGGRQHRTSTSSNSEAYYANFNRALDSTQAAAAAAAAAVAAAAATPGNTSATGAPVHFSIRKPAAAGGKEAAQAAAAAAASTSSSKENKENHKQPAGKVAEKAAE